MYHVTPCVAVRASQCVAVGCSTLQCVLSGNCHVSRHTVRCSASHCDAVGCSAFSVETVIRQRCDSAVILKSKLVTM